MGFLDIGPEVINLGGAFAEILGDAMGRVKRGANNIDQALANMAIRLGTESDGFSAPDQVVGGVALMDQQPPISTVEGNFNVPGVSPSQETVSPAASVTPLVPPSAEVEAWAASLAKANSVASSSANGRREFVGHD